MPIPKDPRLIPKGSPYCYRWVDIAPGEVVPATGPEWGRSQRERASPWPGTKQVLCPFLERSGYGTVRCLFVGEEVLEVGSSRERLAPKLVERFGTADAFDWFEEDSLLGDWVSVCRVPPELIDHEDSPARASNMAPGQIWPDFAHLDDLGPGEWVEHHRFGVGYVTDVDYSDDCPRVAVNFGVRGEKWLAVNVAPLRRIAALSAQEEAIWRLGDGEADAWTRPPLDAEPELASLGWSWQPALVGPFSEADDFSKTAGVPGFLGGLASQRVRGAVPPFKALRSVLNACLTPGFQEEPVWEAFWKMAKPATEPLSPPRWPQGVACRTVSLDVGRLPEPGKPGLAELAARQHRRLRDKVQALRLKSLHHGRWWPAPMQIQLLLGEGRQVGLRMRFAPGYQPPYMPWVVHWAQQPKGTQKPNGIAGSPLAGV